MIEVKKRTIPHYPKSFLKAIILCWVLGFLGIHRFYTGYKRIGLFQMLTLGGFGIWWMIDLFAMCFNAYKDKYDIELDEYNGTVASLVLTATAIIILSIGILSIPVFYERMAS